ncbi:PREDICTED: QWRF motif-containing protein 2-like isoform X2 [Lupinus angustifolius]|uniref:QWRF motif-containing protein 2-like isoform X2 n=1 Tax=Lupinus angustifolius TaxID=3871 RepID=UPI00092E5E4E|nr:PREDICTED: QWRF motif-containing protein 2-like isoform X2 [Lupinus angustifolius]
MVVATISEASRQQQQADNNGNGSSIPRRTKGRQVSSRYMSPSPSSISTSTTTTTATSSSSRRFQSPLLSRSTNSTPLVPKRSHSVERRRPRPMTSVTDNAAGEVSTAAAKLLVTSSRSLSVSFQGEAFSLPISKAKTPVSGNARKTAVTPERRRSTPVRGGDQGENSKPVDQHRWPGWTRNPNLGPNNLTRSLNVGIGFGKVVRALEGSVGVRMASFDAIGGGLSLDLGKDSNKDEFFKGSNGNSNSLNSVNECSLPLPPCDLTASDTDSVSSGSTSGAQDCAGATKGLRDPSGIVVSARFWQETNSRLRRLQDPGSPLSTSPSSRMMVPTKNNAAQLKRYNSDGPVLSPRTMASPSRGHLRPASPSKLWASSPSRGNPSPARVRSVVASSINGSSSNTPSILNFSAEVRRGKIGEERIYDAHTLRLLYNRYVQWRFVNARADSTFMMQKLNAERHLWNAWVTISELRHSVILKRIKLLLLRRKLKLTSILKGQISYMEEWSLLDRDHSSSLLGATEALRASTLRLPVAEKAIADVPNLKDALGSAVDVMQAMGPPIYSLSSKVEETTCLVAEMLKITSKERFLLEQCKDFLSTLAAMQVKDCSLRTHMLQLSRVPNSST